MTKSLGISLALLILLFNLAAAQSLTKKAEGLFVTEEEEGKIAMKSGQRLIINAASSIGGELILKAEGKDCHYNYRKLLKSPTKVDAADYASVISVEIEQLDDAAVIYLRAPSPAPWSGTNNSGRLMIEVQIPENCEVEINTAYFDIDAVGPFTEFIVTESLSKVAVEKVFGSVDIKVSNRPLIIKDVTGNLVAINKYDRLRLENIDTGDNLGTVTNEHGEITIDGYRGGLDARCSYDRIIGQNLVLTGMKNRIKNVSGLISLEFESLTAGKIRINNQYENINLDFNTSLDAQFICKIGDDGSVNADHLVLIPLLVDNSRLEFETGQGSAEVRVTARGSGNITIIGPDKTDIAGGR